MKSSFGSLLPCGAKTWPRIGVLVRHDLLRRAVCAVGDGQGLGSVASTVRSLVGSPALGRLRLGEPDSLPGDGLMGRQLAG
jgi:hypothetical protein